MVRDVVQFGPNGLRDALKARPVLGILEELQPLQSPPMSRPKWGL